MEVYGLQIYGADNHNGAPIKIYSKQLFKTKEEANNHKEEFLNKCFDETYIRSLDREDTFEIKIITYNLN